MLAAAAAAAAEVRTDNIRDGRRQRETKEDEARGEQGMWNE